jgi:hypothetical protein
MKTSRRYSSLQWPASPLKRIVHQGAGTVDSLNGVGPTIVNLADQG